MRIELTILFDMCDFCRTFPIAFVEKIADKIPEEGLGVRLVGCGINGNTGRPLISIQKFSCSKDVLRRQATGYRVDAFSVCVRTRWGCRGVELHVELGR